MDYIFLSHTLLFQGTKPEEVEEMLQGLDVRQQHYDRGRIIYHAGDTVDCLGVVISGCVQIENVDWWGNRSVLGSLGPGEVFAETYASLPEEPLKVSVVASEETEVLFLNVPQILKGCSGSHEFHPLLLRNLFRAAAQKNLRLSQRIFHTSPKSIRGRLLSFLSSQAAYHGSNQFQIPYNRQQLADYLNVDRSALSHELSKMQKEGLLRVSKDHFELISDGYGQY